MTQSLWTYIDGKGVECGEHVIPVDEGEEALGGRHDGAELEVVGTQDQPASKYEPDNMDVYSKYKKVHIDRVDLFS